MSPLHDRHSSIFDAADESVGPSGGHLDGIAYWGRGTKVYTTSPSL
jgi:hypothetical protein